MNKTASPKTLPVWNQADAAALNDAQLLLYRSNLLGSDLRITNFGGGNTSAKLDQKDPLTGETVRVLWVKGSGGDLGSMQLDGFSTLYMDKLHALQGLYRGQEHEDEMVGYLPHCTFNLNPRAASIDTPLHAYLPFDHVDHLHPDAVIAIAATADSEALTAKVFGRSVGWLPWRRPGYELGLQLQRYVADHPGLRGVVLAGHGLFTWGEDSRACYENSVAVIAQAQEWLATESAKRGAQPFGGIKQQALAGEAQNAALARLLPVLRGHASLSGPMVAHLGRQDAVLEFVNSHDLVALGNMGTSCPDHFLRTKIKPLILDPSVCALEGAALSTVIASRFEDYRNAYSAYYQRCQRPGSPAMRNPNPVIVLLPGIGMVSLAKDKSTARIAAEFYVNAINVMRDASAIDAYVGLPEQEAFDIEYWLLEEAKLLRLPKARPLAGRVALVTGGAGGIGRAIVQRLLEQGACCALLDIDPDALQSAVREMGQQFGTDVVRGELCDVTSEDAVIAAFANVTLAFGGVDIVVSNAGIASAAPIEDTSLALWKRNQDILATGYFLIGREAFRLMKAQAMGGSMVFVASKNGLVASNQAIAYCAAKAAEIQLSRSFALEGAPLGIRSNVVNPDAVIRGSGIWTGTWSRDRAAANKVDEQDLEAFYRERSLLKRSVLPEDVAEAVYFLASDLASKSTGNIINVDAGNLASFTR